MNSILTRIVGWFRPKEQSPQTPEIASVYTGRVTDVMMLAGIVDWQMQTIRMVRMAICNRSAECKCDELPPVESVAHQIMLDALGNRRVVNRREAGDIIEATARYCAEQLRIVEAVDA